VRFSALQALLRGGARSSFLRKNTLMVRTGATHDSHHTRFHSKLLTKGQAPAPIVKRFRTFGEGILGICSWTFICGTWMA